MKTRIFLLATVFGVSSAMASFQSTECSTSDGRYQSKSGFIVGVSSDNHWMVNSQKRKFSEVKSEVIEGSEKILEEQNHQMMGSRDYPHFRTAKENRKNLY